MGRRAPSRAALLSALLSRIVMLIQLEVTMSSSLPTSTGLALLPRGHLGRAGENSTEERGLQRTFEVDSTVTAYPETSDSGQKPNTEMPFVRSTQSSAQRYTELDVSITKDNCSNQEGLCATTLSVLDTSTGGTLPPETHTSRADVVTGPSLPVQYTDMEGASHPSLEDTRQKVNERREEVLEEVVTQHEMLRTSQNDGTATTERPGPSNSEIFAISMGSFLLALLVCSLSYQLVVYIRKKRTLERSCSVYIIQNHMHKNDLEANDLEANDLEANNSEPETRF